MSFQSTVNFDRAIGIIGEPLVDQPSRIAPLLTNSVDASYNVFGRAFTFVAGSDTQAAAGNASGNGIFAGLLVTPKEHSSSGTAADGALAPTLTLRNNEVAAFLKEGSCIVTLPAAANIGDLVYYDNTTGVLGSTPPKVIATGSIATTVLTVTAVDAASAPIQVGQLVTGTNITIPTYIASLGTGTGGIGTYNISDTQTAASGAVFATATAPSGKTLIPGRAFVDRYNTAAAGLAVVTLVSA